MKRGVYVGYEGGEPQARGSCAGEPYASERRPPGEEADDPPGGDRAVADEGPDAVAYTVGGLLIELGEKIRKAGAEGVRIITDEELQRDQLGWFRAGWAEHARATSPGQGVGSGRPGLGPGQHPDSEGFPVPPARLLHFRERQPEGRDRPEGPPSRPAEGPQEHRGTDELRLPIVGAGEARVRDLMPHRPRVRRLREGGEGDAPPDGEPG